MREFESPEKQKDEQLTTASDLYSLGVIGLTLYGVSFSTTLKISKPIHCPFGLYDKLKALTNQTPESRPPLDEIIDALDFETNPGSINNMDSNDKSEVNKKSIQKDEEASIKQKKKEGEGICEVSINPQIVSQTDMKHQQLPSLQFDMDTNQQSKSQTKQSIPIIPEQKEQKQQTEQKQLQIKSEIIHKKEVKKIVYDFNPFKSIIAKDINYVNPMQREIFLEDHEGLITQITTDNKNEYVLSSSLDGSVNVYEFNANKRQLKLLKKLSDFTCGVSQVLITKDNNYIVAADLSSNISIYTMKEFKLHKQILNLFDKKTCILSIDISSDNTQLLVSATYKNILLCTLNNFQISKKGIIEGISSDAKVCRFYQNNSILVGEDSGKILVYNRDNLITPIKEINDHSLPITQISIAQDNFAVSSQDKTFTIYDKSFNKLQSITTHIDSVSNVSISQNESTITSNGWDGSTCLYKKNAEGQYQITSCFSNETSWSNTSVYIEKSKAVISAGGRFIFIFV